MSLPATQAAHDFWHSAEAAEKEPSPFSATGAAGGQPILPQLPIAAGDSGRNGAAQDLQKDAAKEAELAALRQQVR